MRTLSLTHTHAGPAVWYAGQMHPEIGSFTQYLYFLFSPTLLYRDSYPRYGWVCVCVWEKGEGGRLDDGGTYFSCSVSTQEP